MKKKGSNKKQQKMPEFEIKQFTPEENRIYEEAVNSYRSAVAGGKKLKEAFETYIIKDEELRSFVQVDFLKILIAERHFGGREPLDSLAKALDIPMDLAQQTLARMLQEVGVTAADQFVQETGGLEPKTDD